MHVFVCIYIYNIHTYIFIERFFAYIEALLFINISKYVYKSPQQAFHNVLKIIKVYLTTEVSGICNQFSTKKTKK